MEPTIEDVVDTQGAEIWEFVHRLCHTTASGEEPYKQFMKGYVPKDTQTTESLKKVLELILYDFLDFGPQTEKAFFNILELADYLGCQRSSSAQMLLPVIQQLLAKGKITGFYRGVRNVALAMRVRQRLSAATFH